MTDDNGLGFRRPATFAERFARPEPERDHAPGVASAEVAEPSEATVGSGSYKPYGFLPSGKIGETCEVLRWIENTETPEGIVFQYRFLMQVGFVGETQLRLFLPDCIVVIEGERLLDLRQKLARRRVTFVQQYSPLVWPARPPKGEPIIERVQVARPETLTVRAGNG